jgi:AcrR family transcriptional regulator
MAQAPSSPARVYQGLAADERRARRRERLLEAGLQLLGTDGWQATTVSAICESARLTPRYFYENFRNRDELLVAVFDGVMQDITRKVVAAGPGDVHETLRSTITAFVEVMTDDPRKGRVAFVEALGSEALMRRRLDTMRRYAELIAAQARVTYKVSANNGYAIETAGLIAAGGLIEAMIAWLDGGLKSTAEQFIEDYTTLCAAGLTAALQQSVTSQPG